MDLVDHFLYVFQLDFLRYFIPASLAYILVWKLFHKRLAHRVIQSQRSQIKQHLREFKYSISSIAIYSLIGVGIFIGVDEGIFHIYKDTSSYSWWYLPLNIFVLIIWHDSYFYWTHKWMHHPKIYRYIHRIHHQSISPSPWTAYAFHPVEAFVQAAFVPIILLVLPTHGLALMIFLIYQIVRNVIGHLGYEFFGNAFVKSKWLRWHTTTSHHDQHHHYFNHNYGLYFTWWDRWMKTEYPQYEEEFLAVKSRSKIKHKPIPPQTS